MVPWKWTTNDESTAQLVAQITRLCGHRARVCKGSKQDRTAYAVQIQLDVPYRHAEQQAAKARIRGKVQRMLELEEV